MKTLKITFLLLAVVLLTVSGKSSDTVVDTNEPTLNEYKSYDLMVHNKAKIKLPSTGFNKS